MNIPEIVAFHQEFKLPNVIDHLILHYCNMKLSTIHELYTLIYNNYSVVTYTYIDKRALMLKRNGLLYEDWLYGSDRALYSLTDRGIKYLKFMDNWVDLNKKKDEKRLLIERLLQNTCVHQFDSYHIRSSW